MTNLDGRAQIALQDLPLQQALGRALDHFVDGRMQAMAALPHGEALRDHARNIRSETLAHLDEYLLAFEQAALANGSVVHWARDAAEARNVVLAIARDNAVRSIVKSKSMLSEEIELNGALQQAGLEVIETDLGEYIAQLDGDRPSHIIAPVVHKRLEDVAVTFNEHLGTPLDATIPELAGAARVTLRQAFLEADMGISGANFAVAESGSIVLVTNEGNGRFVSTTPRIHVALVGIERLAPTYQDLGTLLQVLARSATGQPLSAYTSIVTGPGRSSQEDAPQQVHIVLIDNGRTEALKGQLAEMLLCIRCGACLNVCPVYRNIGGHSYGSVYAGPMGIVVTPAYGACDDCSELPQASSLCGACKDACPVRIDIPGMLLHLRAQAVDRGDAPSWLKWGLRVYAWAATHPHIFRYGAQVAAILQRFVPHDSQGWSRRLPPPLSAWTDSRDFPPLARRSFSQRWAERSRVTAKPAHPD